MRKWLLTLALCVGLGLVVVVWLAAEDARQAALLDARVQEAEYQTIRALERVKVCGAHGAPAEEVHQAELEYQRAASELLVLRAEHESRQQSWPARLRQEVRRRTGW